MARSSRPSRGLSRSDPRLAGPPDSTRANAFKHSYSMAIFTRTMLTSSHMTSCETTLRAARCSSCKYALQRYAEL